MDIKESITTIFAIGAFLVAFFNYRNSARKGLVEELEKEVALLKQKLDDKDKQHAKEIEERDRVRGKIIGRMNFFKRLALKRESQVNRLMTQVKILNNQVDGIGRMYNQTTLEVFDLRNRLATATGDQSIMGATAPLPPLPDDAK